ncbi:MAG: hypothetical protein D6707_03000 [Bacteroidetes bacterium]|nr:MAG: hypothetical protein D6707_03000 [Bacteroidota bacterium]
MLIVSLFSYTNDTLKTQNPEIKKVIDIVETKEHIKIQKSSKTVDEREPVFRKDLSLIKTERP